MSKFWLKSDGLQAMGKIIEPKDGFEPIPDNTLVNATIDKFLNKVNKFEEHILTITWKIIDGEFNNRRVFQDIKVFNTDADRPYIRDSALEMLKYLYRIFNLNEPSHAPTDEELSAFWDKEAQIKIKQYKAKSSGNISNYVAYVTAPGAETTHPMNDDIPF